ncbi:hypothetical protein TanjilG_27145 [Lupinus angustifolius]|uniref:HMA domain-containing protein n=1 Tax=Lupinus angustifolius TaxID=3871 RepID=A0A4P1QW40_LUPAN|nr:hypothetical protein TanjilG_27145 [Lupinus angustifolius]
MKVEMHSQKCRSRVLKIASGTRGVEYVGIEGEDKDRVVVVGDEVDAANLTICMRRKVGYTDLISVSKVEAK